MRAIDPATSNHRTRPPRVGHRGVDYRALADLRYQIRRFLRVREVAARAAGVAPQQYLLLLQVKGLEGLAPATIGTLAERLQTQQHSVVQLVDRLAEGGMVARRRDARDRREVLIELLPRGESVLRRLARHSVAELRSEGPALVSSLTRLIRKSIEVRRALRKKRKGDVP